MKFPKFRKISTIPKEIIDNTKKIDTTYTFQDIEKEGDSITEQINEKPVEKKEEPKSTDKLIESKPVTFESNKEPITTEINDSKKQLVEAKPIQENTENLTMISDTQGIMRITDKNIRSNENTQQIVFRDASAITAEKLPAQLGTNPNKLAKGEYDERRLTNITPLERVWIGYFNLLDPFEGGIWASEYAKEYMNLSMSIGGERAKLLVKMQMASSGGGSAFKKPEDKRNFIERHFTKRGQEPKEDDMNEL